MVVVYRGHRVAVVVPAYNEEQHIGMVLGGMPDYVDAVYVVDDASTDSTSDIVRAWAASASTSSKSASTPYTVSTQSTRVHLLQYPLNRGVGAAISTGYLRALADGADTIAVMAGDNQMDPAELPRLLDPIVEGSADYAKGDRFSCQEHLAGMSCWRRLGNRLLTWLTRVAVGNMKLNDPQNGYTAVSATLLQALPLERLYPRYGYCNQLLCWISDYGGRILDVPMPSRYLGERSKIRYATYIPRVSWLLLRLFVRRVAARFEREKIDTVSTHPV